ncbi:hypothetical protein BJY00DRAFT_197496 [Aspergillus carlsbadensis]|nr:hypothetical protein BJY00DRAFT_197496 [Aspergillus carlsbadensis]
MKGLHGSIPLAVLAATAHAQAQVIGGSGGADIGNQASIATKNTASTSVSEDYTDDHSFELEHEVHVYPQGKDHHRHDRRTGGPSGPTLIGGPSGVDVGNSADIPTVNSFSSSVDEDYKDDHSVDIDKTTIIKNAKDHHRGKDHHKRGDDKFPEIPVNPTMIGGPSGVDIGNIADIPTFNDFSSSVSESYKDDHSVDVDKNTIIKGGKDRRSAPSVIDGPGGVDVGNSASIPTVNEFSSSFTGKYKDDHSVDIDKTTIIKKPDHHWGGKDRRNAPSVIDGPGGVDVGNDAFIPTVNKFSASFTGKYKDDHSVDIDKTTIIKKPHHDEHPALGFHHPMHQARGDHPTLIGGPSGVDIGNSADIPTLNSFVSSVDESYTDDHSVDVDKTFIVKPYKRAQRQGDDDAAVIGGPYGVDVGNAYTAATLNSFDTETHENVNDDHSVKIKSHEVIRPGSPHYEGHGEHNDDHHDEHDKEHHSEQKPPQPALHSNPQPPAPAKPEDPECTDVQEVVHTVTSTRTEVAYQTQTAVVYPHEAHSEDKDDKEEQESWHQTPGAQTPSGGSSKDQSETPKGTKQSNSNSNYPQNNWQENSQTPSDSGSDSSWSDESPSEDSAKTPGTNNWQSSPNTDSGSTSDSTDSKDYPNNYYGSQVAAPTSGAIPTPTGAWYAPGTSPTSAWYAPTTSAAIQEQASTFAVIPLQVPSGTPRAHGSVVVGASSTPVGSSSARYMHMPTGASAEQNEKVKASPVAFTGGAGKIGASQALAGALSVVAGVCVLLGLGL